MSTNTGLQNEIWARKLIDGLIQQGIDYFCCGPGSRSTPLSLAVANHPKAKWTVHFDERGLGFHALGYGKSAKKPAVVIATSGTAIGNLMPAIMEASNDRIPLLILSADRPPELRDCGANQTVDQVKLFGNLVRWQVDLPCPDDRIPDHYLASTLSHAILMANYPPAGPVHINCMFREPLFSTPPGHTTLSSSVAVSLPIFQAEEHTIAYWTEALRKKRQGVILVGSSAHDLKEAVFPLAKKLNWPVFADILSGLRTSKEHPELISHFDPILKIQGDSKIDAVIQFGHRSPSKVLMQWLEKQTLDFYLAISEQPMRHDPSHRTTHRVVSDPTLFSQALVQSLPQNEDFDGVGKWHEWDQKSQGVLAAQFAQEEAITEPGVIRHLGAFVSENWNLFLGNSMPIRDANQFFFPEQSCSAEIFGNRGVSGIDGNIATACGIAEGNQKPTLMVIGDLTFLHDLNSLDLVKKSAQPIVICVVNNGGGGIFSFMPVSKREEAFEEFIAAAHGMSFQRAAELFQIPYLQPQTNGQLAEILKRQQNEPYSCIVEITTDRAANVQVHHQIITEISACLTESNTEIPAFLH